MMTYASMPSFVFSCLHRTDRAFRLLHACLRLQHDVQTEMHKWYKLLEPHEKVIVWAGKRRRHLHRLDCTVSSEMG